jgi:hypothetical protein
MRLTGSDSTMTQAVKGKLTKRDERVAQLLRFVPWLTLLVTLVPLPLGFFLMFLTAATPESAAVYLFLAGISLGLGVVAGLVVLMLLFLYRKHWFAKLRDRLAADGITGSEVVWFEAELTTSERETRRELTGQNPLLADAYVETLAARLTASRIIAKADHELVRVRRRISQARNIVLADATSLQSDLEADHKRLNGLKVEAGARLAEAKARLQAIEAAASRNLTEMETDDMLRRLTAAQEHLPLTVEMEKLEREALRDAQSNVNQSEIRSDTIRTTHQPLRVDQTNSRKR